MVDDFAQLPDLASRSVNGSVLAASDEFFAERENLIKPGEPEFRPHTFTNKGQEYDGWETGRRTPGDHDWAIIRLGIPGRINTIVLDTAYFKGNFPPFASVEGCGVEGYPEVAELVAAEWMPVLAKSALVGDARNVFTVDSPTRWTHLRLRIYPDGGVARIRAHGTPIPDPRWLTDLPFDLAALANGGLVVRCSDRFFSPPNNMLQSGTSRFMGDGWETARRRDSGHDWAVVRLAARAVPRVLELDTTHYKGNAPDRVAVSGIDAKTAGAKTADANIVDLTDDAAWWPVLPATRLQPDTSHRFRVEADRPVTHLRLDSCPDGGLARFRAFGQVTEDGHRALVTGWYESLPPAQAAQIELGPLLG